MNNFLQPVFLLCALGFHATVAEEIIYAQVGEDVSLTAPLKEPNKYYIWYFNNKQIAQLSSHGRKDKDAEWGNRLTLSPGSLLIRNVTQSDFSIFSCTVKKALTEIGRYVFKLIQLNVAVEPPVVLPGERLSLTCGITSQDHTPRIHWLNPQGQKLGESAGNPTVQATRLHSGQWTCVVTNAGKEKKVNVKVTVIDLLPLAPIPTQYSSESAPTRLTIPCSLAADNTWDQVQSKDIHQVGWNFCPPKPQCNKSSLFLLSLEEDKATWKTLTDRALRPSLNPSSGDLSLGGNLAREGDYECFVKFQNGVTLNRTVRVEVLRIIATPGTQLTTGQQLNLTCTTGHPLPPDIHIEWIPPKEASLPVPAPSLSPSAQDLRSPHLTVDAVGSDQNGTWRCELRRDGTVLTSAVVVLNIESTFSSWMLVTLCAAAAILILLVILIVILQRRRQRRTRRHKRLCKCKNPKPKGFYRS